MYLFFHSSNLLVFCEPPWPSADLLTHLAYSGSGGARIPLSYLWLDRGCSNVLSMVEFHFMMMKSALIVIIVLASAKGNNHTDDANHSFDASDFLEVNLDVPEESGGNQRELTPAAASENLLSGI